MLAAADISRLEQALDRAKADARDAYEDRDAARVDLDRAEDGCASLRARLEDLLGQTEDAAARSERQLHEASACSDAEVWCTCLRVQ